MATVKSEQPLDLTITGKKSEGDDEARERTTPLDLSSKSPTGSIFPNVVHSKLSHISTEASNKSASSLFPGLQKISPLNPLHGLSAFSNVHQPLGLLHPGILPSNLFYPYYPHARIPLPPLSHSAGLSPPGGSSLISDTQRLTAANSLNASFPLQNALHGSQGYKQQHTQPQFLPTSEDSPTRVHQTNHPARQGEHLMLDCFCGEHFKDLCELTIHMKREKHDQNTVGSKTPQTPRKFVRGQDMWIIGRNSEETLKIMSCMSCGESFRSLPELTLHMMKTEHYWKIAPPAEIRSALRMARTVRELKTLRRSTSHSSQQKKNFKTKKYDSRCEQKNNVACNDQALPDDCKTIAKKLSDKNEPNLNCDSSSQSSQNSSYLKRIAAETTYEVSPILEKISKLENDFVDVVGTEDDDESLSELIKEPDEEHSESKDDIDIEHYESSASSIVNVRSSSEPKDFKIHTCSPGITEKPEASSNNGTNENRKDHPLNQLQVLIDKQDVKMSSPLPQQTNPVTPNSHDKIKYLEPSENGTTDENALENLMKYSASIQGQKKSNKKIKCSKPADENIDNEQNDCEAPKTLKDITSKEDDNSYKYMFGRYTALAKMMSGDI